MTVIKLLGLVAAVALGLGWGSVGWAFPPGDEAKAKKPAYPEAKRGDVTDDYHAKRVPDPYRWLEDPDSPETRAWVEAENQVTFAFLAEIPSRPRIKERLTKLWDYEKFGAPHREGDRYFYTRNSGLQNQSVLYWTPSLDGEPRELLDPNTLAADGTVALAGTSISDDGKLLAYGLAAAGSDWNEWKVREVSSGKDLTDDLRWIKFSIASWTKDGKGFFYGRFPQPAPGADLKQPNYYQKLYYHRLGTSQDEDKLVYERPDEKEWQFHGEVTEDGQYLVITVAKGTDDKYRVLYKSLTDPDAKIVELIDNFEHEYTFLNNDGPVFWFKTNRDSPRGRVIAIDTRKPEPAQWQELIPQAAETLESVSVVDDHFIATYLKDARTQVKVFDLKGQFVREVALPGIGTAAGFGGKRNDKETFYTFTSYTVPLTVYRYEVASGQSSVFRRPRVAFNPDDYTTEQVFYPSKDGTKIPMMISFKNGLKKDGKNPTYLYGYGGFNISLRPGFSSENLLWMEMGGVFAVPNLRGGGEYGEDWHQLGTRLKKQNVFDDFIAAAEWLIENRYTSTPKLAIGGRSNGGLLVGACLTQRPDLFGATLPGVGVMDMLRFHKFTIGWAWVDDYGSSDDPEQFKALYAYSPLHNIKPGTNYPPTLITTADHDDRVVPGHSFKFAAALQAAQAGDAPVLIRIETQAGHGAGKPTTKIIEEAADRWAFLVRTLDIKLPEMNP
ncbi:MAG TPA: prolyl oligopeptidase family serine peptidase [Isosphaeraceae bacterium]|jgi:prolyl oligopeptidase|nr:prolyl oligopeptidase family serine peptidase [Isosphaeraceae bacterium]